MQWNKIIVQEEENVSSVPYITGWMERADTLTKKANVLIKIE